ncbi:MAG TPA: YaaR family protein [Clostridia bacterium]|nr:YaaR family protein [Clostridia bacterium]
MKVVDSLGNPTGLSGMPVKDDIKIKAGKNTDFRNQLAKAEDIGYEQRLEKLVQDIVTQGEALSKRVDVRELKLYRKLIAEFLDTALGNSKKFSKKSLLDRRGRHKVYAIVQNINDELEKLTQDVLNGEKDNISLLQRLEDIRGLILDLYW